MSVTVYGYPSVLRTISDCVTFEDLDHFIAARASMIHVQVMMTVDDICRDLDFPYLDRSAA